MESIRSLAGSPANCSSKTSRTGRDGLLELSFREAGGRTVLEHRRFAHPLQALVPFYATDGTLCMLMLNISGGMVGGDRLTTKIDLGANAHAVLTTASAAKAYRTIGPPAAQLSRITLETNATLEYLPDHLIPHAGALVEQSIQVEMASGSRAILYDAMAAGRVGRGERWQFRSIRSDIAITTDGRPLYLSRSLVSPQTQPLDQLGWMENANYLGTMIVVANEARNWQPLVNAFHAAMQEIQGVRGGASALARGGCLARFTSMTADGLNRTALKLWAIARLELTGREGFPLRKL
jgi:urease accessory protein